MPVEPDREIKGDILVVDDTPVNLRLLVEMLTEKRYKVRPASSGKLALSDAFANPPDLILLDIKMPEMDGYEVCKCLKDQEATRDIPVIFISALDEVFDKVKAFSVGGVDYIAKPFHVHEVLARIEIHLAIRALQTNLREKNEELTQTVSQLRTTQAQLIESEKMAALGTLVAGVAHEINTPIGNGIMAASILANETQTFLESFQQGALKKSELQDYLDVALESTELILSNLNRAGKLVQSFKRVAVDQASLEKRCFNVKKYLEETLVSLEPQLKKSKHIVTIQGDDTLVLDSYPGAFYQIVINLVLNSLNHAYGPEQQGHLCFNIKPLNTKVILEYADDGAGIPPENLSKIFDPFFTTARSQGGSGLGLHIVYNLVTQKLKGTVRCESQVGRGTQFIFEFPASSSLTETSLDFSDPVTEINLSTQEWPTP